MTALSPQAACRAYVTMRQLPEVLTSLNGSAQTFLSTFSQFTRRMLLSPNNQEQLAAVYANLPTKI
jgi:hypothetical protein